MASILLELPKEQGRYLSRCMIRGFLTSLPYRYPGSASGGFGLNV